MMNLLYAISTLVYMTLSPQFTSLSGNIDDGLTRADEYEPKFIHQAIFISKEDANELASDEVVTVIRSCKYSQEHTYRGTTGEQDEPLLTCHVINESDIHWEMFENQEFFETLRDDQLNPNEITIQQKRTGIIPPDGDCAFHVMKQCAMRLKDFNKTMTTEDIRKEIVTNILEKPEIEKRKIIDSSQQAKNQVSDEEYSRIMGTFVSSISWGTDEEMNIFGKMFKIKFHIWVPISGPINRDTTEIESSSKAQDNEDKPFVIETSLQTPPTETPSQTETPTSDVSPLASSASDTPFTPEDPILSLALIQVLHLGQLYEIYEGEYVVYDYDVVEKMLNKMTTALENLILHPKEEKYQRLKTTWIEKFPLSKYNAVLALLGTIGFKKDNTGMLVCEEVRDFIILGTLAALEDQGGRKSEIDETLMDQAKLAYYIPAKQRLN